MERRGISGYVGSLRDPVPLSEHISPCNSFGFVARQSTVIFIDRRALLTGFQKVVFVSSIVISRWDRWDGWDMNYKMLIYMDITCPTAVPPCNFAGGTGGTTPARTANAAKGAKSGIASFRYIVP